MKIKLSHLAAWFGALVIALTLLGVARQMGSGEPKVTNSTALETVNTSPGPAAVQALVRPKSHSPKVFLRWEDEIFEKAVVSLLVEGENPLPYGSPTSAGSIAFTPTTLAKGFALRLTYTPKGESKTLEASVPPSQTQLDLRLETEGPERMPVLRNINTGAHYQFAVAGH